MVRVNASDLGLWNMKTEWEWELHTIHPNQKFQKNGSMVHQILFTAEAVTEPESSIWKHSFVNILKHTANVKTIMNQRKMIFVVLLKIQEVNQNCVRTSV